MRPNYLFDKSLISRYDKAGPRYTSYPTAVQFHDGFQQQAYEVWANKTNEWSRESSRPTPLSLYFHIPFCDTVCFYCGCSKIATKDRSRAAPYLEHVYKELEMQSKLFDTNRVVRQLHWGGGTPTFISNHEMRELMEMTRKYFTLLDNDDGEYSIEIDPREVEDDSIRLLRDLGFNRMSLGVQDFDPKVQKAVNRIQPEEKTLAVLKSARESGFKSISMDLIYGLPFQTVSSFEKTIEKAIAASPDRLSIFNYAHLPKMFKPQRRINEEDLPKAAEKLDMLSRTMELLSENGYVFIGMDHFAKPADEMAIAQQNGTLYRNFQGYSTHADCDLIALGVTSISKIGHSYSQNVKTLDEYYSLIGSGCLPLLRGIELSRDDLIRRKTINQLICHFVLDCAEIANEYDIDFREYFSTEIGELNVMQQDGLIEIENSVIRVLPIGRLLIRNICMVFDKYLRESTKQNFSKVI